MWSSLRDGFAQVARCQTVKALSGGVRTDSTGDAHGELLLISIK